MDFDLGSCQKIAVLRRNGLGDLLCSMPILEFLKKQAPNAETWLIIEESNACLAPYLQGYDHLYILPKTNKYWALIKVFWAARSWQLDLAISTKSSPMKYINLLLYALQARHRVAWVENNWHSRLINQGKRFQGNEAAKLYHQSLKVLQLMDPGLASVPSEFYPKMHIPADVRRRYQAGLDTKLASIAKRPGPSILISVTNRRPTSTFGLEKHAAVLNQLAEKFQFNVIISAEPKDENAALALQALLKAPSCPVITHSFDEFVLLLDSADLIFVGDGGIMHMAAALDKPQVVLFGKTQLTEWRPLTEKAICHYHPEHVQKIPQEEILHSLSQQLQELHSSAL